MHYLTIKNIAPGMMLAKSIIGDDGKIFIREQNKLTEANLTRIKEMGFQGAYIDTPLFSDVIIDDIITQDLRMKAFEALSEMQIDKVIKIAREIVHELKYKKTLKLDLLDIKDDKNYLFKHCISVCVYSVVIAINLGFSEEQMDNLAIAGILHDVGKLEVSKKVLNSKNKYNEKDMDEMKKHPINAFEMLKDNPGLSSVTRNAILFHHENLDGSGYYNETEDKIGIFPRILRVMDVYDSMTTVKKYRDAKAPAEAIEYIMANSGKLFDSGVVEEFVKNFPLYPVGFTLRLSNGELGVIISNENSSIRPKIRKFDGKEIDLAADAAYRTVMITEIL